jgi:serine/threonine-protein kinase
MLLYEMWRADIRADTFRGGCLAVWDMTRVYGPEGRGMQCSSADAAGFPIAPLLFTADEVAAGEIRHALRFAIPNETIRDDVFVAPATHAGAPDGPPDSPPYGARFRLRPDYPLETLPNEPSRVIARALQHYGMFLADGGNITLMGESDHFAEHSWEALGLGSHDLMDIAPDDFEVMPIGEVYDLTYDCERTE